MRKLLGLCVFSVLASCSYPSPEPQFGPVLELPVSTPEFLPIVHEFPQQEDIRPPSPVVPPTIEQQQAARDIGFCLRMRLLMGMPGDVCEYLIAAADQEGIDRYFMAAVLGSEQSGKHWDFSPQYQIGQLLAGKDPRWLKWQNRREDGSLKRGGAGEQGLCQFIEYWNRLAEKEGILADPGTMQGNMRLCAFVLRHAHSSHAKHAAQEKHENCNVIAHFKCGRDHRRWPCGRCQYKKNKFERLLASLKGFRSPTELHKKHKRTWAKECH